MAEQLIDGTGDGYLAGITSDNRLKVEGTISGTMGSAWGGTGSVHITNSLSVNTGSESWVQNFGDLGSSRVVSGIVNMGSAWGGTGSVRLVNAISVETGSEVWQGTDPWIVLGSVAVTSPISATVTTGSEMWVQNFGDLGSTVVVDNFGDLGSVVVIDDPASIGSWTGVGSAWGGTGSVHIVNDISVSVGSETWVQNFGDLGSTVLVDNFGDLGSVVVIDSPTTIGSFTDMALGSSAVTNFGVLGSSRIISGTATVAGSIYTTGSINIATALSTIGSYTTQVLGSSAVTNFGVLGSSRLINGSVVIKDVVPDDASKNNGVGSLVYADANLGSIVKNIGGTEYVKVLSYSGTSLVGIGSWVEL